VRFYGCDFSKISPFELVEYCSTYSNEQKKLVKEVCHGPNLSTKIPAPSKTPLEMLSSEKYDDVYF